MLGQVRKIGKAVTFVLLFGLALSLVSCATKKTALVDDANQESSIPWNKQEKWESSGPMSGLTDRR